MIIFNLTGRFNFIQLKDSFSDKLVFVIGDADQFKNGVS